MTDDVSFTIKVNSPIFSPSTGEFSGGDRITNSGFEVWDQAFTGWTHDDDGGNATITRQSATPDPYAGTYYCEIYSVNGGDVEGSLSQDVTVEPGERYRLTIWSRTSDIFASMQGRWAVYDNTNAAWIVPREGTALFSSAAWQQSSLFFTVPKDCVSIKLYLYQNFDSDSYVYYDDISLDLVTPGSSGIIADYTNLIGSYQHTMSVNMGFDTMSFGLAGELEFLLDWLENGLGRHIVASEASSGLMWEGFVNAMSLTVGGFTFKIGPMAQIINRGRIVYNQLDWSTTPPIGGDTVVAQWNDVLDSQARYGILEGIISGGEGTADEMLELVNSLMPEISRSASESSMSLTAGGSFSATIECLGYGHFLDKYYYTQVGLAGEYDASQKIYDILARDPNNMFVFTLDSSIAENTIQVEKYSDGTKTGLALIKETTNLGDSSDNRHIFSVYDNRSFEYGPVPTDIAYRTKLTDPRVRLGVGGFINPWEVRPGRWLKIDDVSIGGLTDTIRPSEDPSLVFIEKVNYTAPYGLSLTSGRASTFKQRLDRLGLGGL